MKRIFDSAENCIMAIDGEFEFELAFCYKRINYWKQLYFKSNSKKETKIMVKCWYAVPNTDLWIYQIYLIRNGVMQEHSRICKEAYDVLIRGLPVDDIVGQVEFVTLEHFICKKN